MTLPRALAVMGMDWLCDRLSRLSVTRWDHLPLTDLMPALQVHAADPALPGWPEPVRAVINGLGGWSRLRRLTPADLSAPAAPASAETVLSAIYRDVLSRIPAHRSAGAATQQAQTQAGAQQGTHIAALAGGPAVPAGRPALPPAQAVPPQPHPQAAQPQPAHPQAAQPQPAHPQAAQPQAPHPQAVQPQAPQPQIGQPQLAQPPAAQVQPGQPALAPPQAVQPGQPQPGSAAPQAPAPGAPAAPPTPEMVAEHPLVGLVDSTFREWQPLEQAVAVERLFATDPISLRTLAHRLGVDREVLSLAQRSAEERVLLWLRSPASSPLTGHLFRLTEWLGAAATEEQLVGADPSHPVEVPILRTPLWRVLVTLMPDRRLQEGWLVVGDLGGLRERTRQLVATKPAEADVVELLAQLGIRSHSARAWLDALGTIPAAHERAAHEQQQLPQRPAGAASGTVSGAFPAQLPRRTPGVNGHARGGQPVPQVANTNIDPSAALATLSALSANAFAGNGQPRPPHLTPGQRAGAPSTPPPPPPSPSSDPRRWQRIDVTSEHLRGEPVAVPEGYAAQLGMRPGTLLSVTGPGDNAVVLVWRDRQPVFDSLQPVLMRLNARPGDQVYVTVDGYRLDAQLPS
ncbi:hypothetical protein [Microtetraspora sp. NBRC 13810]|uniref:hypothetical protein n=1 Tax=Microtetraspora sp. NBRC 13810 TaxID=3030990 RepID=UPI002553C608|nr:hypothetical protein [Microtetraspora sp. NBRC 13810]